MKLIDISKNFGKRTILKKVNMELPQYGHVVLVGANGSGKTTLLNIIAHRLSFDGQIIYTDNFDLNKDLFYVYSDLNFFDNLTILENAKLVLDSEELPLLREYINKFELNYLLKRKIKVLSDGEKQKLALILAFIKKAKITLLDEPMEFIDKESKPLFREEIAKLSKVSLVIETAHIDNIEANLVYKYENYGFDLIRSKDNLEFKEEASLTNGKIYHFDNIKNLFRQSYNFLAVAIDVLTLLFVIALTTLLGVKNVSNVDIFNSFYPNYSGGIVYDLHEELGKEYERNVYEASAINTLSLEIQYTENPEDYPYDVSSNNYYKIPNMVSSDKILINGKLVDIADKEIYISDYDYAVAYAIYLDNSGVDAFELTPKGYIVPRVIPETYDVEYLKIPKYKLISKDFKIKVYSTGFTSYLPDFSFTTNEIQEKLLTFETYVENYISYAFMNSHTITYFMNDFYVDFTEDLGEYYGRGFAFAGFNAGPNSNMAAERVLAKDEMVATIFFARNILKITDTYQIPEEAYDKYYDVTFTFNGKSITKSLKLVSDSYMIYEGISDFVYISNELTRELYQEFNLGSAESYPSDKVVYLMLDNKLANADLDNYLFLWKDDLAAKIEYKDTINQAVSIAILVIIGFYLAIFLSYLLINIHSETKYLMRFRQKGCGGIVLLNYNYLFRLLIFIFIIIIGIIVGLFMINPVANWFGLW